MKLCIAVVVATFLTVSAASSGRLLKNEERINYPVCERQTLLQLKRTSIYISKDSRLLGLFEQTSKWL